MVEQTPGITWADGVELIAPTQKLQGDLDVLEDETAICRGFIQSTLRIPDLCGDVSLAMLELIDGDGVCEVSIDQLGLGAFELGEACALEVSCYSALGISVVEGLQELLSHCLDGLVVELNCRPVPSHRRLYLLLIEVGQLAVVALLAATEAEEVAVASAVATSGVAEAESLVTASAVHTADEVVALGPGAVSGMAPAREHALNLLPGDFIDERFVPAGVGDTLVHDPTEVVLALEDPMHLAAGQRGGGQLGGGS